MAREEREVNGSTETATTRVPGQRVLVTGRTYPSDDAYRAVRALDALGGKAPLKPIVEGDGRSQPTVSLHIKAAIALGWIERSGTPNTSTARYALTHDGRAEVRRRENRGAAVTVALGSAPDETPAAPEPTNGRPSLRTRVIKALCEEREWGLIDLTRAVRSNHRDTFGPRDVATILNTLNKQGLVTFVEGGHENGHHSLMKIRATKRLLVEEGVDTTAREIGRPRHHDEAPQHAGDRTDFRTHETRAEGGPIEHISVTPLMSIPAAEPEPWPILAELRERIRAQEAGRTRSEALIDAAELLAKVDPEESERLFARGSALAATLTLTPIEDEYLRFAEGARSGEPKGPTDA